MANDRYYLAELESRGVNFMELEQISLPVNNVVLADYWAKEAKIHSFFAYRYEQASFEKRIAKLRQSTYQHERLSEVIRAYMEPFGISEKGQQHLRELASGAVAVVGGQQAGALTGPLYSVHKAISVLKLAEEQCEKLQTAVVPIFWIAGEDHDLEEINHTYTIVDGQMKKRGYSKRSAKKTMASTTVIDQAEMAKFIETVFKDFGETMHTEQLLKSVLAANEQSETFTQFFTHLMNDLFKDYGLLMVDAAYGPFRQLESSYFERLIVNSKEIARVVVAQEQALADAGYNKPMEATVDNANLFYVKDGERFLLERQGDVFKNTNAQVKFTTDELLAVAQQAPAHLSNNVVTRPLMQEMAIPVLAFVGGPGELAYWATLKPAFDVMELDMPIFAPRLHVTLVTRQVERYLEKHELTVAKAMQGEAKEKLALFIDSVRDAEALAQIDQMERMLSEQYGALQQHLTQNSLRLDSTLQKNQTFHHKQFDYLKQKVAEQTVEKHQIAIGQFDTLNAQLYPNASYQERFYTPYQYLNDYGLELITHLIKLPMTIGNFHNIVKY